MPRVTVEKSVKNIELLFGVQNNILIFEGTFVYSTELIQMRGI